jgi:allantoinase
MSTVLIRGGTIVTERAQFAASVLARDGRVTGLFEHEDGPTTADEVIDARGKLVLPGGVDIHCHFREPDPAEREGFETGSAGAAAGGITTVVEQPQATPAATTAAVFTAKIARAEARSFVDFALWGGVTPDGLDELRGMHEAGAAAFKAYLCSGSPQLPQLDDGNLLAAMKIIATWGGMVGVHAENEDVVAHLTSELRQQGRRDGLAFAEARPIIAECEAIRRAAFWAGRPDCRMHVLHASGGSAVATVTELRQSGRRVTVETCPHYLLLSDDALAHSGPLAKCSPPLRSEVELESLWRAVVSGEVDVLASDHAPYNLGEKAAGDTDIFAAPSGTPANETMLPLVLDEGLYRRNLSLSLLARMSAANPAKLARLYPRKGTIALGSDADLAIYDPDSEWRVRGERLHGRQKWTPYEGRTARVRVERVLVRGQTVFQDGEITASPGFGQFLRPDWHSA